MKKILLGLGIVLIMASVSQAATMYAICRLSGGNPQWWGEVQGTAGEGWHSSNTYIMTPNRTYGICAITGTAAQLLFIAGLSDVLPICTKATATSAVPLATRIKVNTWLSNNGFAYQFPADTTGIDMAKKLYKYLNGPKWEQEGAPDPDDEVVK